MRDRPVVHALEHPQHVGGRQNHTGGGACGHARIPPEYAEQNQELADEPVQARQPNRRERDDQERSDQMRHDSLEAAELGDEARVAAIREHADDQEQAAGAHTVIEHLIDRALHALRVHRRDAEHDEAEMAHARIGDELLHVRLHHRHKRTVDNADHREEREIGREP